VKILKIVNLIVVLSLLALSMGCKPDVGSKEWCEDMRKKPKGDWTANETVDFAKHCIFENKE
jgi:hypothetical protein